MNNMNPTEQDFINEAAKEFERCCKYIEFEHSLSAQDWLKQKLRQQQKELNQ